MPNPGNLPWSHAGTSLRSGVIDTHRGVRGSTPPWKKAIEIVCSSGLSGGLALLLGSLFPSRELTLVRRQGIGVENGTA